MRESASGGMSVSASTNTSTLPCASSAPRFRAHAAFGSPQPTMRTPASATSGARTAEVRSVLALSITMISTPVSSRCAPGPPASLRAEARAASTVRVISASSLRAGMMTVIAFGTIPRATPWLPSWSRIPPRVDTRSPTERAARPWFRVPFSESVVTRNLHRACIRGPNCVTQWIYCDGCAAGARPRKSGGCAVQKPYEEGATRIGPDPDWCSFVCRFFEHFQATGRPPEGWKETCRSPRT